MPHPIFLDSPSLEAPRLPGESRSQYLLEIGGLLDGSGITAESHREEAPEL
jgi:hypothetical protein